MILSILYIFFFFIFDIFMFFLILDVNMNIIPAVNIERYKLSGFTNASGISFTRRSLIIPPPHAVIIASSVSPSTSSLCLIPFNTPEMAKAIVPK